jgi:hypothetical protein
MNPKLSQWYHNHPQSYPEWIVWILDTAVIGYFAEQLLSTFLEVNFNNSINPVFWIDNSQRFKNILPFQIALGLNPIKIISPYIGNHFITLILINATFFYLLYKLDLNPFWIGITILFAISVHEWLWFFTDYAYYIVHNIPFNLDWIEGSAISIIQALIIIFIFPWKFVIRDRKIGYFISSMFALYFIWWIIGFPVTYDFTRTPYLTNGWVAGWEIITWIWTLVTLIKLQPFKLATLGKLINRT